MCAGKCINSTLAPWKILVMFATRNVGLPGCGVNGCVYNGRIKVCTVELYDSVRL